MEKCCTSLKNRLGQNSADHRSPPLASKASQASPSHAFEAKTV